MSSFYATGRFLTNGSLDPLVISVPYHGHRLLHCFICRQNITILSANKAHCSLLRLTGSVDVWGSSHMSKFAQPWDSFLSIYYIIMYKK